MNRKQPEIKTYTRLFNLWSRNHMLFQQRFLVLALPKRFPSHFPTRSQRFFVEAFQLKMRLSIWKPENWEFWKPENWEFTAWVSLSFNKSFIWVSKYKTGIFIQWCSKPKDDGQKLVRKRLGGQLRKELAMMKFQWFVRRKSEDPIN